MRHGSMSHNTPNYPVHDPKGPVLQHPHRILAERTRHICLSREDFDKLRSGEEEDSLEVGLKSWCIVKLE